MIRSTTGILGWIAVACLVLIAQATACQICLPIPKESMADHLLSARHVAFARENPEKPFILKSVEVLKGEGAPPIELFLDSATRRTLAAYPDRKVICVHRGGEGDEWKRVGMTDERFEPVVREILERASAWKAAPRERFDYFARFLGDDDRQLRQLAHLEVARAPYNEIKTLKGALSSESIRAFLINFRYIEWHSLYILLLAQSDAEEDRLRIRDAVRSAERFSSSLLLAAWATAWIEIDRSVALDFLVERFLAAPGRDKNQVEAVLSALSVHGHRGHTELRDSIVAGYLTALDTHPDRAKGIVSDLISWERYETIPRLSRFLRLKTSALDSTVSLKLRSFINRGASLGDQTSGSQATTPDPDPSSVAQHKEEGDETNSSSLTVVLVLILSVLAVALSMRRK